eukprot:m.45405 g.45405  ORF g.45405 m.45405 type:complete len:249 (-) comp6646_c0_seq2:126-872(-)
MFHACTRRCVGLTSAVLHRYSPSHPLCARQPHLPIGKDIPSTPQIKRAHTGSMSDGSVGTAWVLLAEGAEEIETVAAIDVLRRANIDVTVCGLDGPGLVRCSRGVQITPDVALSDAIKRAPSAPSPVADALLLPGGAGGSARLRESAVVGELLQRQDAGGKIIASICAATTVLLAHGIRKGAAVTSHPGVKDQLTEAYKYDDVSRVVVEGNLITSRGPGTAIEWALAVVEHIGGAALAKSVDGPMINK